MLVIDRAVAWCHRGQSADLDSQYARSLLGLQGVPRK